MESPVQGSRLDKGKHYVWPLALVVLFLGFAFLGDRGILHMFQISSQKALLLDKIAESEARNESLRQEISALRNDRNYIERIARTELGMVRDDELVFQFTDRK